MDLSTILSSADAGRAHCALVMLRRHQTQPLVLAGGLALELHMLLAGVTGCIRPLNDIDFLVDEFVEIPATLASDLLFRHVHPHDPPGKMLIQCVHIQQGHAEIALRVDIFRAYGRITARAVPVQLDGAAMRMVGLEDLAARMARLCMNLAVDEFVPAKHTRDLLRVLAIVDWELTEEAWQDHRKPGYPASFAEAARMLTALIAERPDLQVVPVYSRDTSARCSRCEATPAYPLADAARVLSLLGYC